MNEEKGQVEEQRDVTGEIGQRCARLLRLNALYKRHDDIAVHENLQQVVPIDKKSVLPGAHPLIVLEAPECECDLAAHEEH